MSGEETFAAVMLGFLSGVIILGGIVAYDKEVYKMMIVEYEVGKGIVDAYDLSQIMCYKLHMDI